MDPPMELAKIVGLVAVFLVCVLAVGYAADEGPETPRTQASAQP